MYAIVFWEIDSTFTVVALKTVTTPRKALEDYKIGENVSVPFQGKSLQCKLYEIGESRAVLNAKLNKGFHLDLEVLGDKEDDSTGRSKPSKKRLTDDSNQKVPNKRKKGEAKGKENGVETGIKKRIVEKDTSMSDEYPEEQASVAMKVLRMRREVTQPLSEVSMPSPVLPVVNTTKSRAVLNAKLNKGFHLDLEVLGDKEDDSTGRSKPSKKRLTDDSNQKVPNKRKKGEAKGKENGVETGIKKRIVEKDTSMSDEYPEEQASVAMKVLRMRREVTQPLSEVSVPSPVLPVVNTTSNGNRDCYQPPVPASTMNNPAPVAEAPIRQAVNSERRVTTTPCAPPPAVFIGNNRPSYDHSPSYIDLSISNSGGSLLGALSEAMDTVYDHQQYNNSKDNSCHGCCSKLESLMKEMADLNQQMRNLSPDNTLTPWPVQSSHSVMPEPLPRSPLFTSTPIPPLSSQVPDASSPMLALPQLDDLKNQIKNTVKSEKKLSRAVQRSMKIAFSVKELTSCTLKGHHTNKFVENPRLGLPADKRCVVVDCIREVFGVSTDDVDRKMRTVLRSFETAFKGIDNENQ